ncbi:MAG: hypothetical protein Q7U66_13765 [Methylobacter sp.]|nr:hypothetical protein [Methylobacter sp.]
MMISVINASKSTVLIVSVLVLFNFLMPDMVYADGKNAQFVPGEVMVKFRNETESNQLLSRAIQSSPPDMEILAPVASLLSGKVGIPLKVKQILSGGWILLAVDVDKLVDESVTKLRKREAITDVQLRARAGESKSVGAPEVKGIDVTFRSGSSEYETVEKILAGKAGDSFARLIQALAKILDLPLQGRVDSRAHLILQVDLRELTVAVDKRLRDLSEIIDSVQLNYVSTGMN